MSERKVLNKYYPPDFDPSKIPRMKLPKNRQYTVRLMAPFNMRCTTCGEYIYKGKKFNARKEDVENETYLGIRIYRFYIKCTRCLQEISFKTDPQNTDYEIEAGATRNFMALKLAEEQAIREEKEAREEEASNPMKLLENRTQQSRNEIEVLESLEELKDLNRRQQVVNYDDMLSQFNRQESESERLKRMEMEDEEFIRSVNFKTKNTKRIVAEEIIEELDDFKEPVAKMPKTAASTSENSDKKGPGNLGMKNLVKRKELLVKPKSAVSSFKQPLVNNISQQEKTVVSTPAVPTSTIPKATSNEVKKNGLSMLAQYSDCSDDSE